MKKLVIFDLDGTLLDTLGDLAAACNHALEKLNFPTHEEAAYRQMVGNGVMKLFERALPQEARNMHNQELMRTYFTAYYNCHDMDRTHPYEGAHELLVSLRRQGLQLGVASNKYQQATGRLVLHYFRDIHFCGILGQREGFRLKPDRQIVDDLMRLSGVTASEVLYVGDSAVDMQTARNAGVEACGVTWGFRGREELEAEHPEHIIDRPDQLLDLL
ncbi:MAG: HAD family hydrolase [Paludibacteraceae bacterium]|nr:HAD family hydrolase [Paludibacteraceae bacterium]